MEYRYTSTEERVYVDRALTVNTGDVVDWPDGPPADGHWEPTEATRDELDRRAADAAATANTEQTPPGTNWGAVLKSAVDGAKDDGDGETEGTEGTEPGPAKTAADTTKE